MSKEVVDTLGLDWNEFKQWADKPPKFLMHQIRRKIRYRCFALQRGDAKDIPQKFLDHYEAQPHFSGWELFGDRWDVTKADPLQTYPRKFSLLEEWEATLRMAVPELPGALSYKQSQ